MSQEGVRARILTYINALIVIGNLKAISARAVIRSRCIGALIVTVAIIRLAFVHIDAVARFRIFGIPINAAALKSAHRIRTLLRTAAIVHQAFVRVLARFAIVERFKARIAFTAIGVSVADLLAAAIIHLTHAHPLTLLTVIGQLEAIKATTHHLTAGHITHIRTIAVVLFATIGRVRIHDSQRNARFPIHVQVHISRTLALITVRRIDAIVRALCTIRVDVVQVAAIVVLTRTLVVGQMMLGRTLAHK